MARSNFSVSGPRTFPRPGEPGFDPDYQPFCIYCQREYDTFAKLKAHLRRKHRGTYAQESLAPTARTTRSNR